MSFTTCGTRGWLLAAFKLHSTNNVTYILILWNLNPPSIETYSAGFKLRLNCRSNIIQPPDGHFVSHFALPSWDTAFLVLQSQVSQIYLHFSSHRLSLQTLVTVPNTNLFSSLSQPFRNLCVTFGQLPTKLIHLTWGTSIYVYRGQTSFYC